MADNKGRSGRLRAIALGVLIAGVTLGFLIGAAFPAQVGVVPPGITKVTTYTQSTESGDGTFNWLFAILVMGPAVIAAAVLFGSAEIVGGLRRSGRSSRSDAVVADGKGTV